MTDPAAVAAGFRFPYSNFLNDFGGSATVLQALRPYPQFSEYLQQFRQHGSSFYNAMQVQLEKRLLAGLSFLVSTPVEDDVEYQFRLYLVRRRALNKDNQKAEWSLDNNDQPQILNIAGTYELPIGPG